MLVGESKPDFYHSFSSFPPDFDLYESIQKDQGSISVKLIECSRYLSWCSRHREIVSGAGNPKNNGLNVFRMGGGGLFYSAF